MERKTQALTSDSETAVLMEIKKSVPKRKRNPTKYSKSKTVLYTSLFSRMTPAAPQLRKMTPAAPQLMEFHLLRGKSDVCRLCLHCISVCRSRWLAGSAGGVRSRLYVYCSNTANTEQGKH